MKKYLWITSLLALGACTANLETEEVEVTPKTQVVDESMTKDTLKVGNLNMSIGFEVTSLSFKIVQADSFELYKELKKVDEDFIASKPMERLLLMAKAIKEADLDVVALQEVMTMEKSDIGFTVDYLEKLKFLIDSLGGGEYLSSVQKFNELELEFADTVDVAKTKALKFSEGNATIYKSSLKKISEESFEFKSALSLSSPVIADFKSQRGVLMLELQKKDGRVFQVWNTHIEVETFASFAKNQTMELFELMDVGRDGSLKTQVLLGDLNSTPEGANTMMLTSEDGVSDAWLEGESIGQEYTCCQTLVLDEKKNPTTRRIDYILLRDHLSTNQVTNSIVGPEKFGDKWVYGADHSFLTAEIIAQY